jgi:chaperone required for assembly of F1-ATPase
VEGREVKRFYKEVTLAEVEGGWQVMLDGRGIRTQGGRPQVVPSRILGEALASEWRDQGEEIDSKTFLFRDLADFAIDVVAHERKATIEKLLGYAETDTLCYRADPEDALFSRQQEAWEPLLGHLEGKHSIRFQRISGVMHRPQPADTLAKLRVHLETLDDFILSGMVSMASLAASLCVALLANDEAINDPMLLWGDANLEEEWQADKWGREEEAEERRANRGDNFSAAQVFVTLVQAG